MVPEEWSFILHIVQNPTDRFARGVYADWLIERGDEEGQRRGRFILDCVYVRASQCVCQDMTCAWCESLDRIYRYLAECPPIWLGRGVDVEIVTSGRPAWYHTGSHTGQSLFAMSHLIRPQDLLDALSQPVVIFTRPQEYRFAAVADGFSASLLLPRLIDEPVIAVGDMPPNGLVTVQERRSTAMQWFRRFRDQAWATVDKLSQPGNYQVILRTHAGPRLADPLGTSGRLVHVALSHRLASVGPDGVKTEAATAWVRPSEIREIVELRAGSERITSTQKYIELF